jgi:hypothetical protein
MSTPNFDPDRNPLALTKPSRRPGIAVLVGILIVGAAAAGHYYGQHDGKPVSTAQQSPSSSVTPAAVAAASTENVTAPTQLDFASGPSGYLQILNVKLSLTVPTSWRATVNTDSLGSCSANYTTGALEKTCPSFNFANALGSPTSILATNSLKITDLSNWLIHTSPLVDYTSSTLSNLSSTLDKARAITNTEAITSATKMSITDITGSTGKLKYINPFLTNAAFVNTSPITPIASADGRLHGYAVIATIAQDEDYNPHAYIVLVGKANNQTVMVTGEFVLNDKQRAEFVAVNTPHSSAIPSFLAALPLSNVTYPSDTLDQYNQVLTAVKTLTITY